MRTENTSLVSKATLQSTLHHEMPTPPHDERLHVSQSPHQATQPFAALLAADQVLNGESISVPSTPTKSASSKLKHGSHPWSSLSVITSHYSVRTRPVTSDGFANTRYPLSAPSSQLVNESAERERHDRDSTISISDAEDGGSDDDVIQSQASSLATDMLRKNPASQESLRLSQGAERSSNLLQTKLFGNVKKPVIGEQRPVKRSGSFGDAEIKAKKAKLHQAVGLGIKSWTRA